MTENYKEFKWYSIELEHPGEEKNYHGQEMKIGKDIYMYTMMRYEPYFAVYINGELDQRYPHSSAAVGRILNEKERHLKNLNEEK